MKRIFITYGDEGFEKTKKRIIGEARSIGIFDEVLAFGPEDLSEEILASSIIKVHRGGGVWCWKPEMILSTLSRYEDGDIIVYCDAGCTLSLASEWNNYWKKLSACDIIAQRILQRTDQWTRQELISLFSDNGTRWLKDYQYLSGAIFFKNSPFCRDFVKEWRDIMISHPECVEDVPADHRHLQHPTFIESRHDQSVFSALIYKYLLRSETRHLIYTKWEHIEFYDIFYKQAIRATRLRTGEQETIQMKAIAAMRRLKWIFLLIFSGYALLHWWYSRSH